MTEINVLDFSNHDYQTFDAACLKASGVGKLIFGCWDLGMTVDMVGKAREAGIDASELYCFTYPRLAWEMREVQNAVEVQRQLGGITIAWPDCESQFTEWPGDLDTEAAGTTVADRLQVLRNARAGLKGARMLTGTYTGDSYWKSNYGGTDEFADDPLWLPNYGRNDPANPLARGSVTGITLPSGRIWKANRHQYSSTIVVCGRNRDHNYELIEVDDMSQEDRDRLARLERLIGGNGIDLGDGKPLLTGEAAIAEADKRGWSAFLGIGQARQQAADAQVAADQIGGAAARDIPALSKAVVSHIVDALDAGA